MRVLRDEEVGVTVTEQFDVRTYLAEKGVQVNRTGRQDEVHGLRLGHRQVDEVELWSVACHQAVHQAVEYREDPIQVGIGGLSAPGRFECCHRYFGYSVLSGVT